MVLCVAFVLLVSLGLNAILTAAGAALIHVYARRFDSLRGTLTA